MSRSPEKPFTHGRIAQQLQYIVLAAERLSATGRAAWWNIAASTSANGRPQATRTTSRAASRSVRRRRRTSADRRPRLHAFAFGTTKIRPSAA
ncbi:hypothetical protein [Streptomyces sp. NPDC088246]|uniref:hypothetical protein n=1 Tax=Streptomyces sp. NPDC088246 TaxID=3365842 RepID=UPI0037FF54E2